LAKVREKGMTPKDDAWKLGYREPEGADVESLGELPEGWCWATVDQIVTYMRNGLSQKPEVSPPGYRILRINAVRPMKVDLEEVRYLSLPDDEAQDYFIEDGDILFTRYNGSLDLLGVAGRVKKSFEPTLHPDKLIRIKTVLKEIFAAYIEIACNLGVSRAFIESRARTTAGQKGISGADIRQTPVPIPPLAEQEQVVSEVEARLSDIEQFEATIEANLKRAENERQGILQDAFAGKLVEQDAGDEPASVLLERIREERKRREVVELAQKREKKMAKAERAKRKKVAPLYDVLVEVGGKLTPEELSKRSEERYTGKSEGGLVEEFYTALVAEMDANLIEEEKLVASTIILSIIEQEDEGLEEEAEEELEEHAPLLVAETKAEYKISTPSLWDE
jgi:type I restriction enzyme, S subunit